MSAKIRVFVAHSFEKAIPPGQTSSDLKVAEWFVNLLRSRALGFEVITGSKGMPIRIDDKVKAGIADSACLLAVFTKRHYDTSRKCWLPPQFVLCEAAMALGFFHNTTKLIGGFYEEGLDPKDLALITIGGLELVSFRRDRLAKDRARFVSYLKRIPGILRSSTYPDIGGKWLVTTGFLSDPPQVYDEKGIITQQFGQTFQGFFTSPHPEDEKKMLRQEIRGQFLDSDHAQYSYKAATRKFTEFGVGLFKLDRDRDYAQGASVNYGISAKELTFAVFSLEKLSKSK